jgi:hypothetical protein
MKNGKLEEYHKSIIRNVFKKRFGLSGIVLNLDNKKDSIVELAQQTGLRSIFILNNFDEVLELAKENDTNKVV